MPLATLLQGRMVLSFTSSKFVRTKLNFKNSFFLIYVLKEIKSAKIQSELPWGLDGKDSACNRGDLGSIRGLGRFPGEGHSNPLQHSCLENIHGQRSLAGYSPRGRKESDTTERLSTTHKIESKER